MLASWSMLLQKRRFLPLFLTQFFGAFNDNAFKLAMLTLMSYQLTNNQSQSEHYQAIAGALFTLPFFVLSATAGQMADKYDKAKLTRLVKILELCLMILGGFALKNGSIFLMMLTLLGMGVHSTFFGPIKYAILPDHLPLNDLLQATGLIEASTFIAILLGTTLGALAIGGESSNVIYAVILTNSVAIMGLLSSFFIPPAPSHNLEPIDWRIWRATGKMLSEMVSNKRVVPAVFAISWFWLVGAILLTKLPDYTHYVLGANTTVFALFLALFSIGIALGSLVISSILKSHITLRYVPWSMLLLSLFAADLYFASPETTSYEQLMGIKTFLSTFNHWRIIVDFFFVSFCGGLFVVPLYTHLQIAGDQNRRARTIAANNVCNAMSMVLGNLLVILLLHFTVSIPFVLLLLALFNTVAAIVLWVLLHYAPK